MSVSETRPDVSNNDREVDQPASRPLTFTENLVLTLKVLCGMALVGAALWAATLWTAAK